VVSKFKKKSKAHYLLTTPIIMIIMYQINVHMFKIMVKGFINTKMEDTNNVLNQSCFI